MKNGKISGFNNNQSSIKLPIMLDFNLEHFCDLEEMPPHICDTSSVVNWIITNCHFLRKLPDELGNLNSLRMLRKEIKYIMLSSLMLFKFFLDIYNVSGRKVHSVNENLS